MDASIWVKFISKNNNRLGTENIIACVTVLLSFSAMDLISGQLISLSNPIHSIPCQLVNESSVKETFKNKIMAIEIQMTDYV